MVERYANGQVAARYQYQYDRTGNLSEEGWGYAPQYAYTVFNGDTAARELPEQPRLEIFFDSLHRMKASTETLISTGFADGTIKTVTQRNYTYDADGHLIREEAKRDTFLWYTIVWQYSGGIPKVVRLEQYRYNYVQQYSFRPDGVLETYYYSNNAGTIRYRYNFDEKGNWIERLEEKDPANGIQPGRTFRSFRYQ
jgi:hypothetical protein